METRETEELDAEGYFRTGRRPHARFPFAEIYSLWNADDAPEQWNPPEQERLAIAWNDDYFRRWAEALFLAGRAFPPAAWVIVVFDAAGGIAACIEYRPVLHGGVLMHVSYADARDRWLARRPWHAPRADSCHEPPCPYPYQARGKKMGTRVPIFACPAEAGNEPDYSPASARSAAALSVASQVNSGSSRPKWP
jgi:hypothetical protein